MKGKNDVHHLLPRFYNMNATQFDKKIKLFQSDNAKELAFSYFFSQTGTPHQYTRVECPAELCR